jgi:ABC-type Co2+ transport system permease subunit
MLCFLQGCAVFAGSRTGSSGRESGPVLAGLSLIAAVNTGGAIIKALLTGLVVSYIGKMWPDLLEDAKK